MYCDQGFNRSFGMAALVALLGVYSAALRAEVGATAAVEYRLVDVLYSTEAVVEAVKQSTVSAQVMGRVVELRVDVGDRVKAGQIIARIDQREAQQQVAASAAQVALARANLENARLNRERSLRLLQDNFVSQAAVDRAEAEYKAAEAQLQAAQAGSQQASISKGYTVVLAPYTGIVSARLVELGEMAAPGKPLITTFDPTDMRVIAEVPQERVPELRNKFSVEIPSLNRWIAGKSIVILPSADPRTHTTRVRLTLPGDQSGLYPGVYARAYFPVGQARKMVVPLASIIRRSEITGVYVINENGASSFRQVRLGDPAADGFVEVLAGVSLGERVALEPLKAGMMERPRAGAGS
jgi:RND family efflux transporter MFP subunit